MAIEQGLSMNYPIQRGNNGYFEMTYDTFNNERIKLINLMSTVEGERIMQPQFGIGMHKYLFEEITSQLKFQIELEIKRKISFWLPNLKIDKLEVNITDGVDRNQVYITIQFSLINNPTNFDTLTFQF